MFTIAVCDDLQSELEAVKLHIEKFASENNVKAKFYEFIDAEKMIMSCGEVKFDIAFLDIDMPGINGLTAAQKIHEISENTILIFVTCHDEYVYESFKVSPFRYVRKGHEAELNEAFLSAIKKLKMTKHKIGFKTEAGICSMAFNDIHAFTSVNHKVYLCTQDRKIQVFSSLRDIENKLDKYGFIRIHSSYLVNCCYIYSVENSVVIMADSSELPLSRRKAKEVKEKFMKYCE